MQAGMPQRATRKGRGTERDQRWEKLEYFAGNALLYVCRKLHAVKLKFLDVVIPKIRGLSLSRSCNLDEPWRNTLFLILFP